MASVRKRLIQDAERVNPIDSVHIWRSPAGAAVDILIVTHLSVYSCIHGHAAESLPNETGGFLVGRVARDDRDGCWLLEIEEAIAVEPESQDPVHFTFTWRDVDRVRSYREEHGKALIGWYHTHPDLGIFLSDTDLERTHRVLFSEPFQVALVYDPVRGRAGYFFWEGAQAIDASQAGWREFEIAVAEPPAAARSAASRIVEEPPLVAPGATATGMSADAARTTAAAAAPADSAPRAAVAPTVVALATPAAGMNAASAGDTQPMQLPDIAAITGVHAAADDPSASQFRRVRAQLAPDDTRAALPGDVVTAGHSSFTGAALGARTADPHMDAVRAGSASEVTSHAGRARSTWRIVLEVLLVILGFAMGYFWFGIGRG